MINKPILSCSRVTCKSTLNPVIRIDRDLWGRFTKYIKQNYKESTPREFAEALLTKALADFLDKTEKNIYL